MIHNEKSLKQLHDISKMLKEKDIRIWEHNENGEILTNNATYDHPQIFRNYELLFDLVIASTFFPRSFAEIGTHKQHGFIYIDEAKALLDSIDNPIATYEDPTIEKSFTLENYVASFNNYVEFSGEDKYYKKFVFPIIRDAKDYDLFNKDYKTFEKMIKDEIDSVMKIEGIKKHEMIYYANMHKHLKDFNPIIMVKYHIDTTLSQEGLNKVVEYLNTNFNYKTLGNFIFPLENSEIQ